MKFSEYSIFVTIKCGWNKNVCAGKTGKRVYY